MLATIEAVYENGVFRPLVPLDLPNNARVALQIKPQAQDPFLSLVGAFASDVPLIDGIAVSEDPDLYLIAAELGSQATGLHAWEIAPTRYRRGEDDQPVRLPSLSHATDS